MRLINGVRIASNNAAAIEIAANVPKARASIDGVFPSNNLVVSPAI